MPYVYKAHQVQVTEDGIYGISTDFQLPVYVEDETQVDYKRSYLSFVFEELPPGFIDTNVKPIKEYPNLAEIVLFHGKLRTFETIILNHQSTIHRPDYQYNFGLFEKEGRFTCSGFSIYFPRKPVKLLINFYRSIFEPD